LKLKTLGINDYLLKTLKIIQNDKLFDDFYLVGGTALSLQLGHRVSDDIDLFTDKNMNRDAIYDYLRININKDIKIVNNEGSIFQLYIEKERLKLDFVKLPYNLIDPLIKTEGVRLAGKNDISAMKIAATGQRGNEAKDYFDLYYLLKDMSIDKMFENFKKKYQMNDILHYVRSVIYFDDVPEKSWKALKPIKDKVSITMIKNKLINEVTDYQRRNIKNKINNDNGGIGGGR